MTTTPTLMIQGTTSDAGKSTVVAGLCRVLKRRGVRVVPFKPQNMALNSAVTEDGGEIGRAQAVQAQAAGLAPHTDMNPVLLKPNSDTGAQVIIQGRAIANMEATAYHDYKKVAREAVLESYGRLAAQYEMVIVEGAGSPAEINLRAGDIANMGFAEAVDCPVLIVADIDRGGVFAHMVGTLELLQGKNQTPIHEIQAGDMGAVAKLKETQTGDSLSDKAQPIVYAPVVHDEPATTFAIEPKTRGDEDKISAALHRLQEEDPVLRVSRDAQTHEMLLSGMGQLHIEVVVGRLKKRFKVEVNLKKPKIPYRETIKGSAEGHGRHKKQTGGHGQFGDCRIRMKPLPRGSDFRFVDDIFGGSIPKNFIPAVEKGIQDARMKGLLAGYPMVDFQVELYDGQYHDVDSSEMSFKIAGSLGFKDAVAKCRPTLLEPVMEVDIAVPEEYAGAVMGDLSSRRGRPQGMEPRGSLQVIKAEVPMAEMLSYDADLTSMTGGRGSYHMQMSHYDEVPAHIQEKIIAAAKAERAGETEEEE